MAVDDEVLLAILLVHVPSSALGLPAGQTGSTADAGWTVRIGRPSTTARPVEYLDLPGPGTEPA
jgi:hypothetical protein